MENKISYKKEFLKGIIAENPVFVSLLGMCPTLAVTKSVEAAIGMGILVIFVLFFSNLIISLLRKVIPSEVKIPAYIVVIASLVTIVKLGCQAFLPELYDSLGVFISLIVVNCIILGRAEMYANKNNVGNSLLDAIGMGIGFTLALLAMAFIREVFGNGSFAGIELAFMQPFKISILTQAPGGFFVFGCLIAIVNAISNGKAIKKTSFGCEGCPSKAVCGKTSCEEVEEKEAE